MFLQKASLLQVKSRRRVTQIMFYHFKQGMVLPPLQPLTQKMLRSVALHVSQ